MPRSDPSTPSGYWALPPPASTAITGESCSPTNAGWASTSCCVARRTLADFDLADITIPKGSMLRFMLAAGNRDPRVFSDPDTFVAERPNNPRLACGGGVHYCVGATRPRRSPNHPHRTRTPTQLTAANRDPPP
jgi:hypothetical protein